MKKQTKGRRFFRALLADLRCCCCPPQPAALAVTQADIDD